MFVAEYGGGGVCYVIARKSVVTREGYPSSSSSSSISEDIDENRAETAD
jgi:hypothetical protein